MGFIDDFGRGFKKGWNGVVSVAEHVPVFGEMAAPMKLHKGGKVPKTGNFRLKGGEVVLNKTQLAQLKKRKTAKGKQKVINDVSKRRPKKMKGQKVKGRKVKGRGRK
jgi:hypothetical protein